MSKSCNKGCVNQPLVAKVKRGIRTIGFLGEVSSCASVVASKFASTVASTV